MKEIEVKILEIDPKTILSKLFKLGAKAEKRVRIVEQAWDFKNGRISKLGNLVRLRSVGAVAELAFKERAEKETKKNTFKIMEETETIIGDIEAARTILKKIGLRCIKHREKFRTHLAIGATKFEIDEYPGIPPYLEIEGSKESIQKYIKILGFTRRDALPWSATTVLKAYNVNHRHLVFSDRKHI